jgi:hypothetical protein
MVGTEICCEISFATGGVGNILVIYNGNPEPKELAVPGDWFLVINDEAAGMETLALARDKIRIASFSHVIAHKDAR